MKVHGNVDLRGQSQILNFRPEILAADPAVEALFEGRGWWNSTAKALKFFNGTEVVTLAIGGDLSDYIRADGTIHMTADLILSSADQSASDNKAAISKGYAVQLISAKQDKLTGAASSVASADLAANKVVVSDAQGKLAEGSATAAEIAHLSGVTAPIQGQVDAKQDKLGYVPVNKKGDTFEGIMNAGGFEITSLGAPKGPNSAARLSDVEAAMAGLNWQEDVAGMQVDATLDPTATPVEGVRYILTDVTKLHANFGTITGVENNDIVAFKGGKFVVVFDVSAVPNVEGALAWDNGAKKYQRFATGVWAAFGGLGEIGAGVGLTKDGNTLNVNLGAGISELPTDGIGIDLAADSGLRLVDADGNDSTTSDAKLAVRLDGPTLTKTAAGVKVAAKGIGAAEIAAAALGHGLVGGDGSVLTVKAKAEGGIVVDENGVSVDNAKLGEHFLAKTGDTAADLKVTAVPVAETDVARLKEVTEAKAALQLAVDAVKASIDASEVVYDGLATVQTTHTIAHNLNNRYPQVEVVDANGDTVLADVTRVDKNNVSVTVAPATGVVVIVRGNKKPV